MSVKHTSLDATGSSDFAGSSSRGGVMYKKLIVGPQTWTHTTNTREHWGIQLTRMQLPLLHAWAITVHKSQVCVLRPDMCRMIHCC